MIDFPWWFIALLFLYLLVIDFGIGAAVGFIVVYRTLAIQNRNGAGRSRARRISLSSLGALGGGASNFLIATLVSSF